MPFINGRYYINPAFGRAVEAAREAENAHELEGQSQDQDEAEPLHGRANRDEKGPIHRVEIESTEVVTPQSGRGQKGFAARVHREPTTRDLHGNRSFGAGSDHGSQGQEPETHVFSDHRDLVNFLCDQFAKDMRRHS